jgi:hypothetical protein
LVQSGPVAQVHPLRFLDANCTVGPYYNPAPGADWSSAALLRKMDSLGIAEACPTAMLGRDHDPRLGNDWLTRHVPPSDRLHPVWTAGTHHTGEFPPPAELLTQMRSAGVRMLRFFLDTRAFFTHLDLPVLGELFDALDAHAVPLLLDAYGAGRVGAADLEPILRGWPSMPLILSIGNVRRDERWLYYLWERYEQLHLDLCGHQQVCAVENVVRRFGPRRLVYGSRYPYFTPLQTMLQLIYTEVDEAAKRAIAGETLRGLLRGARP